MNSFVSPLPVHAFRHFPCTHIHFLDTFLPACDTITDSKVTPVASLANTTQKTSFLP